jgi:hypothetical protein
VNTFLQSKKAADNSGSATSLAITFTSAVTAGSTLVLAVEYQTVGSITVSDSLNGSWTLVQSVSLGTLQTFAVYYRKGSLAGACTVTIANGSTMNVGGAILEYSGPQSAAPLDLSSVATGTSTASAAGAITPTSSDLLIAAAGGGGAGQTISGVSESLTIRENQFTGSGQNVVVADLLLAGGAAHNPSFTISSSLKWGAITLSFKQ